MKSASVRGLLLASTILALAGCATTGEARNPRDPWEPFNRHAYNFNEGLDRVLLKPVATFYRDKVPPLMRTGVSNFFGNLSDGWSAVNSLLQGRLPDFEENLARFHVNTMFGVLGIFDVASELNIERHREDFGQTLGRWGVPAGPYIMLPFLGPSTLRDTAALPVEWRYNIIRNVWPEGGQDAVFAVQAIDKRANLLRVGNVLEEAALDKYSFTRDAYLQRRRAEINDRQDNREVPPPLPDESKEPPAAAPAGAPPARPPAR
ncbi:MlaA family lipoprotein [Ramlibacter alkalitolerans]|uniref:VacJ family lipoprotein n=1 Tax=Ramlibacter alkalitolerans TaxID=2039631 RepID=A0ABS1JI67_9BURK|nr:VacJ family lipoprotein [Ramlibacter alkalitolerans]MBL0423913.1 VacJ family lipoprotein [Ramlibacter alkalitolerans]